MVVHRRPMAPAGAGGGPIDERGAEPSRTGSPSWVRWALAPYIRCDSRRVLAPRASRLTEPGTEHPERRSVFRTNGLRSRAWLPPEQPGTLPRTQNSSAPPDHRGHRRTRTRGAGARLGVSHAVPSMGGATGTIGTTGTSAMVPLRPCYFSRISMIETCWNIERNNHRSDEVVRAVRAWTVGGVPGRPDACSGTRRARAGCVQGWTCRRSQGPIRARSGGPPPAFNQRALHRDFQR